MVKLYARMAKRLSGQQQKAWPLSERKDYFWNLSGAGQFAENGLENVFHREPHGELVYKTVLPERYGGLA